MNHWLGSSPRSPLPLSLQYNENINIDVNTGRFQTLVAANQGNTTFPKDICIHTPSFFMLFVSSLNALNYSTFLPSQFCFMFTPLPLPILRPSPSTARIIPCPSIIHSFSLTIFHCTLAFLLGIGIFLDHFKVRWNL